MSGDGLEERALLGERDRVRYLFFETRQPHPGTTESCSRNGDDVGTVILAGFLLAWWSAWASGPRDEAGGV